MGNLSCLQQIFLIQELNQGLLHCRQIRELSGKLLLLKQSNLIVHISWCDLAMDFKYKVGKPFTIPCYFVTLTIYLHKEVIVLK